MIDLKHHFERQLSAVDVIIDGDRPWDPQVHDDRVYARAAVTGTLALGEAFMEGWWTCEQLDELVARLIRGGVLGRFGVAFNVARTAGAAVINLQTKRRARTVGEQHYDIGNDLYRAMLDKRMMYSCGYWANAENLADAQTDKLDLVSRKLGLQSGMRVLDIGCGWGGAAEYFATQYGCQVVGLTISVEQAELASQRVVGLPVDIRLLDYRDLNERFDRIVSIGMFEHVGSKNYRTFMKVARRNLADPDSLMLLHTIGSLNTGNSTDPWIAKYIFPNSMLPSAAQITHSFERQLVLEDWHAFGPDYDRTLLAWYRNINDAWDDLSDTYGERFRRMWNFYLLSSAGSFRARSNQLWQLVLSRDGIPTAYRPTRIR